MTTQGDILYIDDDPDGLLASAKSKRLGNRFDAHLPDALPQAAKAAGKANLWVFDYFTVEQERDNPSLDGSGRSGLGVFHQLRRATSEARPPSVLVSSHLEEAIGTFDYQRRHIVAEQLGVEWVSRKLASGSSDPIDEIVALADAVAAIRSSQRSLGQVGSARFSSVLAHKVLSLPMDAGWSDAAVSEVDGWRPPVSAGARELVAWMLRQVLPHPSFLVRAPHLASRLGLTVACLDSALRKKTELSSLLSSASYQGVLAGFSGPRWWSAGVDAIAFDVPRDSVSRTAHLKRLVAPAALQELPSSDWVVVSDADLVEADELAPVTECVRASDEYFPPQAPPSWVRIADAKQNKVLARKVRLEDQAELVVQP